MTILFAISVAAFVALMWASIATAQHIRRARRRKEMADEEASRPSPAPAWSTRESRPDWTTVAPHLAQKVQSSVTETVPVAVPEVVAAPAAPPPPASEAALPTESAIRFPLSSQRRSSTQIPIAAAAPNEPAKPQDRTALTPEELAASAAKFQLRRPPSSAPTERSYFSADAGDLRDPEPQRFRDRLRQR